MAAAASTRRQLPGRVAMTFGSFLIGLVAWQLLSSSGLVPRNALPGPVATATAAGELLRTGAIWSPMLDTLVGAAAGLGIAMALAIPIGLGIGSSTFLDRATSAVLEFLRPVPAPAILPIAILLLGSGSTMKIALVAFGCFFPILVQTVHGIRETDPTLLQTTRAFRISPARRFLIRLLSASPNIFTGVRVSASIALLVAVAVEIIAGAPGLGSAIQLASGGGNPAAANVYIILAGALGVLVAGGLGSVQRSTITWVGEGRSAELR
ncbi:ABC transporter permease [Klenkia sp. LSe6-5]|uniref:ABC transporter permease n=1 Tax=Klenkia sesuvii TaxID=3103137 RepID=A0ABU8E0P6_9ACTN